MSTREAEGGAPAPAHGEGAGAAGAAIPAPGARATQLALVVVCFAVFLTALDQTVVVTAFARMVSDLGVPDTAIDHAQWIVSGYLLGYVIAMPLMGRVADVYGRRRIFATCLVIFGFGSFLCALAPVLGAPLGPDTGSLAGIALTPLYWVAQQLLGLATLVGVDPTYPALNALVAARFLQAVGGGALVPVALAVVGDLFGSARRGVALGLVGGCAEAGGVLGPLWGAWLTGTWGWQWIFWLNLPAAALLLGLGARALPQAGRRREGIDVAGALLFGLAIACLTIGLGAQAGQLSAPSLSATATNPLLLVIAVVALAAFALLELRIRQPVVDPALFRRLPFAAAALLSLLIGGALITAMVFIPFYVATVWQQPPIQSGLALLRLTAFIPLGALAGGWLAGRVGCRVAAIAGCLLTAGGFWLMHLWPVGVNWTPLTVAAALAGLGFGLVIAPISTSALNAVRASQTGSASALVTVLRMVGMILGLAVLSAWAFARFRTLVASLALPSPLAPGGAAAYAQALAGILHQVFTEVFAVAAVLCLLAVIPAAVLWRRPRTAAGEEAGAPAYESYVAPLA